ncbi:head completion/stabilization protein [Pseudomonas sp. RIT-PI-S]|uniref:head completion/stabilization protein n=1 Tax=Pseudomonas sp. RIT-PI-S TaxID=3035295 RepID=UPI0021D85005|nr:head completion/stabilization protein [Pseudomonas sp. RIT-PI-S]
MSAFIAANSTFDNDGFWPDIDPQAVTTVLGLTANVTPVRLEQAVLDAMLCLNRELRPLKQGWRAEGYNTLAEVPAERLHGHSVWLLLYRRALYCAAGARLCEFARTDDGIGDGQRRPHALTHAADDYRRAYRQALSELQGSSCAWVEPA